jgi:hypothetical protein
MTGCARVLELDTEYREEQARDSFWYLASPYSKYPDGLEAAFVEVAKQAALLIRHKIPVYSPIAHTHPIAIHGGMDPLDHSIWLPADLPLMRSAYRGLIVCKMATWDQSDGIGEEIKEFGALKRRIIYMEPGVVPPELLAKAA